MTDAKLKHPQAKKTINVRPDQVEMYESQGWAKAEAPKPAVEKPADKPTEK